MPTRSREGNGPSTREFFDLLLSNAVLASTGEDRPGRVARRLSWRAPTLISHGPGRDVQESSTPSPHDSDRTNLLMPISDTEHIATPPVASHGVVGF